MILGDSRQTQGRVVVMLYLDHSASMHTKREPLCIKVKEIKSRRLRNVNTPVLQRFLGYFDF